MLAISFLTKTLKFSLILSSICFSLCNYPKKPVTKAISTNSLALNNPTINSSRYVTIEMDISNPVNQPEFYFTDLAYDKTKGLLLMKDDGSITDYTVVFKLLNGGIINGKKYSGFNYTDGTGKKIGYKYSFAINPNDSHSSNDKNVTSWAQINEIISKGHAIMNHSMMHGGIDKLKSIKDAEKNMWKYTHYRMTEFVVPSNDEGYVESSLNLGYDLISSEFGEPVPDGNNDPGKKNVIWGSFIPVKTHDFKNVLITRTNLGDQWNQNELVGSKHFIDRIFDNSESDKKIIGAAFSHGPGDKTEDIAGFLEFLTYIKNHPSNKDDAWITSSKELMDYIKTKEKVIITSKSYNPATGKFKIVLDMINVAPNVINRSLSLKIKGGTISNVKVQGANEVRFNASTGLINVYKNDISHVKDPLKEILPPQITKISASKNSLIITYDRPVKQTKKVGYEVSGNEIIAMKGQGKNWQLIMKKQISSGQLFNYRMQHGDATEADSTNRRVCSYIGMPIN